ncbi:hypothetical protein AVEN_110000-1 [Araneus ventricosus]|uniref:Uncharacterized protein n=1 Tax=Araneus ventricosus TaxID=182803 RepID=A0A4Y2W7W0_ARAVE|nr:hypothetical protein AVEN_110000-1 [Araneus ventricosus]
MILGRSITTQGSNSWVKRMVAAHQINRIIACQKRRQELSRGCISCWHRRENLFMKTALGSPGDKSQAETTIAKILIDVINGFLGMLSKPVAVVEQD